MASLWVNLDLLLRTRRADIFGHFFGGHGGTGIEEGDELGTMTFDLLAESPENRRMA
jgi:hypothetical protein